jgi:hypothetical protein
MEGEATSRNEFEYYVVEDFDAVHQPDSDLGANSERISLPIVAGPFDSHEEGLEYLNDSRSHEGLLLVVTVDVNE